MHLKVPNIQGFLQDGSNNSFYPTAHHCIYCEAMVNGDCDYDAEMENYPDFGLAMRTLEVVATQMPKIKF